MIKAAFTLDGDQYFEGYDSQQYWNGFRCPMFDKKTAENIMRYMNESGGDCSYGYSRMAKAFEEVDKAGTLIDQWQAMPRNIDGKMVDLYPIGAMAWTWMKK